MHTQQLAFDSMFDPRLVLLGKGVILLCVAWGLSWLFARFKQNQFSWSTVLVALVCLSAAACFPALFTFGIAESLSTAADLSTPAPADLPVAPLSTGLPSETPHVAPLPNEPASPKLAWGAVWGLVWLGGTLGLAFWLLQGHLIVKRWRRHSSPLTDAEWLEALQTECEALKIKTAPRLLLVPTDKLPGPCIAGFRSPSILLPYNCLQWSESVRSHVLRHELFHLRRRDHLQNWINAAALLLHWPNPLVWLSIGKSRREAEIATDAAVIASGTAATEYAETLLFMAKSFKQTNAHSPFLTNMAQPSDLELRLRKIIAETKSPSAGKTPQRFLATGIVATLGMATLLSCSTLAPMARTNEKQTRLFLHGQEAATAIDFQELKKLMNAKSVSPNARGNAYKLSLHVVDAAGKAVPVPLATPFKSTTDTSEFFSKEVLLGAGSSAESGAQSLRDFPYPSQFSLPRMDSTKSSYPMTPTTPSEFTNQQTGWQVSKLSVRVEGSFAILCGEFQETTFDGFIRNPGEAFSPITARASNAFGMETDVMLTENRVETPTFTQRTTPFSISALPEKAYRVRIHTKAGNTFLEVRCQPAR